MQPRVDVVTMVISYLTASPARDVVVAGHQQSTRDCWETASDFEDFDSEDEPIVAEVHPSRRTWQPSVAATSGQCPDKYDSTSQPRTRGVCYPARRIVIIEERTLAASPKVTYPRCYAKQEVVVIHLREA